MSSTGFMVDGVGDFRMGYLNFRIGFRVTAAVRMSMMKAKAKMIKY